MPRPVFYQREDAAIVDYRIYFREGVHRGLRGPRVPDHLLDRFGVALGSAATFGRFVHQPYAEQLTFAGYPTANFGLAGAKPVMFCETQALPGVLARASFTIIELMSARGYPTRFFHPRNTWALHGQYKPPGGEFEVKNDTFIEQVWHRAMSEYGAAALSEDIADSRRRYLKDMKRLISMVKGSLILLWFSRRHLPIEGDRDHLPSQHAAFPHLINSDVVASLRDEAQRVVGRRFALVDAGSELGLPSELLDRTTGERVNAMHGPRPYENDYYPSQLGHDFAASRLLLALRGLEQQSNAASIEASDF